MDALAHQRDEDVVLSLDVAVGVEIDLVLEGGGVRNVADAEEHEADGQRPAFAGLGVVELQAFQVLLFHAEALFDDRVVQELNLRMSEGALQHDARRAKVLRAVDDGDLGGEASQKDRLLHRGVAAADDGDLLAAGEEAVAGGARADAEANQRLLAGQVEPARAGAGGDDQRAGLDGLLADGQLDGTFAEVDRGQVRHLELGTEARGLRLHVLDELRALHALRPAGKVLHQRGDGELPAGLVAFKHERLQVGAACVDGRSEPRAAGAENDGVANGCVRHRDLIVLADKGCKRGGVP